jgi:hypothetical protein
MRRTFPREVKGIDDALGRLLSAQGRRDRTSRRGAVAALGFNTEEGERGEWAGWAKWLHGPDEAGLVREERWTRLQESLGRNRFGLPEK